MENKPQRVPLETLPAHGSVTPLAPPPAPTETAAPQSLAEIEDRVVEVLRNCYDPEIPVNIHELGLIYGIDVEPPGAVQIRMTLTSPACPVAGTLPPEIEAKVRCIPGVASAKVEVVWDPPWNQDRMSEAARLQLGLF
jgi:FeS assembly SUF system protein